MYNSNKPIRKYESCYTVYIIANRSKKTSICLSQEMNGFAIKTTKVFSRLVYFEQFYDRNKAMSKKRLLEKLSKDKITKLISAMNSEWLDILYTLIEET